PMDRLEPIRKVLEKGKLPLAADKSNFGEIVMKSELQDLGEALRKGLTNQNQNQNQGGGRGGNQNNQNRNVNFNTIIQTANDAMYKKIEASLKPDQAEVIKKWHY